ncbi:hypothetical protein N665_0257s0055 [Sinapis alba]|nr:hypothetical protein N665_0257s0055 [Sinapis alba]
MPLSQSQLQLTSSQANSSGDEPGRTLNRPRIVWTKQLHERFLEAIEHLGIQYAVPKRILDFMNVEGLTRGSVASHLQKYRHRLEIERRNSFESFSVGKGKPSPNPFLLSKEGLN